MQTIKLQREIKFIHYEKMNAVHKDGISFQLLNIADVLITNHINASTVKMRKFYKMVYLKTKDFYLKQSSI